MRVGAWVFIVDASPCFAESYSGRPGAPICTDIQIKGHTLYDHGIDAILTTIIILVLSIIYMYHEHLSISIDGPCWTSKVYATGGEQT